MVTERIISYLTQRGWQISKDEPQFVYLSAPQEFGLPDDYSLYIPKTDDQMDFKRYYSRLLEIFEDFYEVSKEEFDTLLGTSDTVLRVRIHDEDTSEGKINFVRFEGFIERLKAIITDTASFVLDRDMASTRVPAEAYKYLNKCSFLQTEKGSYVTKIQLPSGELIRDAQLFAPEIYAEEINDKLLEVLEFVNVHIFTNRAADVSDEYIIQNSDKLNLKLLKNIETFYDKSDIKNVEFSLHSIKDTKVVDSQNVTKEQINRLAVFIEEVGNRGIETKVVAVRGKIDVLKSKDPDGSKNSITMSGLLEDMPVVAKASLSSEDYKDAVDAHKIKEYVTIRGLAKTTKTRISFLRVDNFAVG
jgi:hypothetical protein